MAGMQKPKEYEWKNSNLALFGSDTERNVKKESAQTEPAWKEAGQKVGLQIWRIEKFKVVAWPTEDYGRFFDGDSYIILNTYTEEGSDALLFDVHFWIGRYSTQDEYGTAAYKTVELDTLLDDVPIQHREVQDHESELFRSYFKTIEIMKGGAESGFNRVLPAEYQPRLLHCHGDRHGVAVREVALSPQIARSTGNIDSTDVYILDLGLKIIQWNGSGSNKDERFKTGQYIRTLVERRSGKPKVEVLDEGCDDGEFKEHLNQTAETKRDLGSVVADKTKQLFRLSDATGKMEFSLEKSGTIEKSNFDTKDVFILDTKSELFVWIGRQTSINEKKNAMTYAHQYLQSTDHPFVPVSCLKEGRAVRAFEAAIAA